MPKATNTGSTNGAETTAKPVDRTNGNVVVTKIEVGGVYVWPSGIAPSTGFATIEFIGASDPTATAGGRDVAFDRWHQLPS